MKKNILLIASLYSYHTIQCIDACRSDMLQRPMSQAEEQLIHAFYADGLKSAEKLKDIKKSADAQIAATKKRHKPGTFCLYNRAASGLKKIGVFPFNLLEPTAADVKNLVLTQDGNRLLVCFDAGTCVYNARIRDKKYSLPAIIGSPVLSRDGKFMLSRSVKHKQSVIRILLSALLQESESEFETEVVIRDLKKGKRVAVLNSADYNADKASATFAHDDQTVFVSNGLDISSYSVSTGTWIKRFFGPSIKYSPKEEENGRYFYGKMENSSDNRRLIALRTKSKLTFSEKVILDIFNLDDGSCVSIEPYGSRPFTIFRDELCAVSFAVTLDNKKLIVWPHDINQAKMYDIVTGKLVGVYEPEDGEKIVDMQDDGTLVCYKY